MTAVATAAAPRPERHQHRRADPPVPAAALEHPGQQQDHHVQGGPEPHRAACATRTPAATTYHQHGGARWSTRSPWRTRCRTYANVNYALPAHPGRLASTATATGSSTRARAAAARFISYVNGEDLRAARHLRRRVQGRPATAPTLFYPNPPGAAHGTAYGDWSLKPGSAGSPRLGARADGLRRRPRSTGMLLSGDDDRRA